MKTPYFLISEEKLNANVEDFKKALQDLWPNSTLAYSVKTNSLPWLLQYLRDTDVFAEVVSDEEYQLARLCGYSDDRIVFNGPIKGEETFQQALLGKAVINLDSVKDLEYLKKYGKDTEACVGIRVNVNPKVFDSKDIGYEEDGFRFGFSEEAGDFAKALNCIQNLYSSPNIGIHLHCNSITRSVNVYIALAKYAVELVRKYGIKLSFIDMGGGYFGGVEGKPTPYDYISAIKNELMKEINPNETRLIVEPGSAIIGSAVDLYTSVLDVKDTNCSRIVTTDGSRVYVDPLWAKTRYMYSLQSADFNRVPLDKQIVCGYTCMDHDRIMIIKNETELHVEDKIIYHRIGAYSMTFGGMFIRYYPDVYVKLNNGIHKVRNRVSVEDYYKINS